MQNYSLIEKEYSHRRVFIGIKLCSVLLIMVALSDWIYFNNILSSRVLFVLLVMSIIGYFSSMLFAFWVLYLRLKSRGLKRIYQTFLGNKWIYGFAWMALGLQTYFAVFVLNYLFYSGAR